jgi:hypothetical protein
MGSAKLSGKIEYGNSDPFHTAGSPAENIDVVLLQNGTVVAVTQSNAMGEYYFENLPIMSFHVVVDIPGKSTSGEEVAFNSSKQKIEGLDFSIEKSTVEKVHQTLVKNAQKPNLFVQAFPNPFTETLTLKTEELAFYTIIDFTGNTVMQGEVDREKNLTLDELQHGNYFVLIQSNQIHRVIKITKH